MAAVPSPATFLRPALPWLLALALAAAAAPAPSASAQTSAPDRAQETVPARADDTVAFRVDIVAPEAIAAAITGSVDLVRWQEFADMTADLFERLRIAAPPQVREAAATQGYFSAEVDIAVDRATKPWKVTIRVAPGEPTRIAAVRIDVQGDARTMAEGAEAIARIEAEWGLPVGAVFRQSVWTSAKQRAVAILAASPFAAASLTASEALIDPLTREAKLSLAIASGPPFRIGAINVTGLRRYKPGLVQAYSPLTGNALYSEHELDIWIRRLLGSGYFASVQATIDPDPEKAADAPMTVAVIEAPSRRLEFGVGFSTDTQYRASASWSDRNLADRALQFYVDARLESKLQQLDIRFVPAPVSRGWIDTYAGGGLGTDIKNLVTRTAYVTARRQAMDERRTPAFGIGFYQDRQAPLGAPTTTSHALYVDGEYTWREVDNLLLPERGFMVNVKVGGGIPGASTKSFGRVVGRAVGWWPLPGSNQISGRIDAGAVIADSREGIPSVFLFRTGGDTTVRGYAFESLGVSQGEAVVGGRYLGVASVEAIHWFSEAWGLAAFVDAGNATDSLSDFRPLLGYGVGGRIRTPVGPFRLDVAYGQEVHNVRIHFSVGLSF